MGKLLHLGKAVMSTHLRNLGSLFSSNSLLSLQNNNEDIVKKGILTKNKNGNRKKSYFVLRRETGEGRPARLEYYDSEQKFQDGRLPKKKYVLKNCFNINRRTDNTNRHIIELHINHECVSLIVQDENELEEWLRLLRLHKNNSRSDGSSRDDDYEHAWLVDVVARSLATVNQLTGWHYLCLTDQRVSLIRVDEGYRKQTDLKLNNIRECSLLGQSFFTLTLGRNSGIGCGELHMKTSDAFIADNIFTSVKKAMGAFNDAESPTMRRTYSDSHGASCVMDMGSCRDRYTRGPSRGRGFRPPRSHGDQTHFVGYSEEEEGDMNDSLHDSDDLSAYLEMGGGSAESTDEREDRREIRALPPSSLSVGARVVPPLTSPDSYGPPWTQHGAQDEYVPMESPKGLCPASNSTVDYKSSASSAIKSSGEGEYLHMGGGGSAPTPIPKSPARDDSYELMGGGSSSSSGGGLRPPSLGTPEDCEELGVAWRPIRTHSVGSRPDSQTVGRNIRAEELSSPPTPLEEIRVRAFSVGSKVVSAARLGMRPPPAIPPHPHISHERGSGCSSGSNGISSSAPVLAGSPVSQSWSGCTKGSYMRGWATTTTSGGGIPMTAASYRRQNDNMMELDFSKNRSCDGASRQNSFLAHNSGTMDSERERRTSRERILQSLMPNYRHRSSKGNAPRANQEDFSASVAIPTSRTLNNDAYFEVDYSSSERIGSASDPTRGYLTMTGSRPARSTSLSEGYLDMSGVKKDVDEYVNMTSSEATEAGRQRVASTSEGGSGVPISPPAENCDVVDSGSGNSEGWWRNRRRSLRKRSEGSGSAPPDSPEPSRSSSRSTGPIATLTSLISRKNSQSKSPQQSAVSPRGVPSTSPFASLKRSKERTPSRTHSEGNHLSSSVLPLPAEPAPAISISPTPAVPALASPQPTAVVATPQSTPVVSTPLPPPAPPATDSAYVNMQAMASAPLPLPKTPAVDDNYLNMGGISSPTSAHPPGPERSRSRSGPAPSSTPASSLPRKPGPLRPLSASSSPANSPLGSVTSLGSSGMSSASSASTVINVALRGLATPTPKEEDEKDPKGSTDDASRLESDSEPNCIKTNEGTRDEKAEAKTEASKENTSVQNTTQERQEVNLNYASLQLQSGEAPISNCDAADTALDEAYVSIDFARTEGLRHTCEEVRHTNADTAKKRQSQ